jgi:hypothetical protein
MTNSPEKRRKSNQTGSTAFRDVQLTIESRYDFWVIQ